MEVSKPTPAQARALVLFELMERLGHAESYACATAVGRRLRTEGITVDEGCFRQFRTMGGDIFQVEVLVIDGAMVDGSGIHADWVALARQQKEGFLEWLEGPPKKFDPEDPNWLGRRMQPLLINVMSALNAELQRQELEANTAPASTMTPAQTRVMSLLSVLQQQPEPVSMGHEMCAIGLYLADRGIKHPLECRLLGNSIYAEVLSIDGALCSSLGLFEDWEAYRMALLRHHAASLAPAKTKWRGDVISVDLANEKAWSWDDTARASMDHAAAILAAWDQQLSLEQSTGPAPSSPRPPRL